MGNFLRVGIAATVFIGGNGAASGNDVLCQPGGCPDILDLIETYGSDVADKLSSIIETLTDVRAQFPEILRQENTSNTLDVLRRLSGSSQSLCSISSELSSISDKGLPKGIKIVFVGQAFNTYLSIHLNPNHRGSIKNAICLQAQDFLDFVEEFYKDTSDEEISDTKEALGAENQVREASPLEDQAKKLLHLKNQVRELKKAKISSEEIRAIVDQIVMLPVDLSK